jgi:hypothetical protein
MNAKTSLLTKAAVAASLAVTAVGSAYTPAAAQGFGSGVLNCDAPGNSQPIGAIIGGVLGAALGSNLAKNDRGTGTAVGALAGAAAGSYIGCRNQRAAVQRQGAYYAPTYAAPASYSRAGAGDYVAGSTVNVRSGPTTAAPRIGAIGAGQTFRAIGSNGQWLAVSTGSGVGFVHGGYVRPLSGFQQASYYSGY